MRWNENEESNNFKSNPIWRKFLVNFSAIFFGASIFVFVITKRHKINLITAFERKMWTTKSKKRAEHTAHGCRDENSFKTDLERGTNCVLWFVLAIVAVCWFAPVLLLARIVRSLSLPLTYSFCLDLSFYLLPLISIRKCMVVVVIHILFLLFSFFFGTNEMRSVA